MLSLPRSTAGRPCSGLPAGRRCRRRAREGKPPAGWPGCWRGLQEQSDHGASDQGVWFRSAGPTQRAAVGPGAPGGGGRFYEAWCFIIPEGPEVGEPGEIGAGGACPPGRRSANNTAALAHSRPVGPKFLPVTAWPAPSPAIAQRQLIRRWGEGDDIDDQHRPPPARSPWISPIAGNGAVLTSHLTNSSLAPPFPATPPAPRLHPETITRGWGAGPPRGRVPGNG
jgi:hypothetical protein